MDREYQDDRIVSETKCTTQRLSSSTVYSFKDLQNIFPFGRTKLLRLCQNGILPVIKVGKTYITNQALLDRWFSENEGHEIY